MKYAAALLVSSVLLLSPLHAQSLTIPLTFTNDSASQVLTIGFSAGASDAYDLGVDQLAPPPPPAQSFDVRAVLSNVEFFQDLRDTTSAETLFHIALTQASGSTNFTMEWDASSLEGQGIFEITDDMDGSLFGPVDMTTVGNLDILSSSTLLEQGLRIRVVPNGTVNNVSIDEENTQAYSFSLEPNFPNPFRRQTDIAFNVSRSEHVKLVIHDLLGKEKQVLVDAFMAPGTYSYIWDAQSEANGMYLYSLTVGSQIVTRSMILVK